LIDEILAEMPDNENILDEPIPDSDRRRLRNPIRPGSYRPTPPPRRKKKEKRRAIEEFDPIPCKSEPAGSNIL
ncbi:MAG: hypothetical protein AB2556_24225, partial [Candidatus Thiodiazotropha sp.]